jgi:hypothetical protein
MGASNSGPGANDGAGAEEKNKENSEVDIKKTKE